MKHSPQKLLHSNQQGIGLIDVMIAVFIFSIGILAIAALQLISKQSNFEAIQRTTAVALANDIMERMRINSVYVGTGTTTPSLSYYVASTTVLRHDETFTKTDQPTSCIAPNTCTEQQIANWDLYEWKYLLTGGAETNQAESENLGGLLEPTACIEQRTGTQVGGSGDYRITIAWRGQSAITNQSDNTCGLGVYGADNEYRRILAIDSFFKVE